MRASSAGRRLRITVDARPLDVHFLRGQGIGRYAAELLPPLRQVADDAGAELVVLRAAAEPETRRLLRPPVPERLADLPEQVLMPLDLRRLRPDLHHSLSIYRAAVWPGVPSVLTMHDVIPLMWPQEYLRTGFVHRLLYRAARRARLLVAVSEAAGRDAADHLGIDPARVVVAPLAADPIFAPADPAPAVERHGIEPPYLLYVGGLARADPVKRVDELVELFSEWAREEGRAETLVLVGRLGPAAEGLRERAAELGSRVRFTGYVPDEDLPGLLSGATCLATCTRYEGFGLPALEAISCGTPVVAYGVGALPEVVGGGGVLVEPGDRRAFVDAVRAVCDDTALRDRLAAEGRRHAAGFSWRRTAELTFAAYEHALRDG